jgi:hypothetical protein
MPWHDFRRLVPARHASDSGLLQTGDSGSDNSVGRPLWGTAEGGRLGAFAGAAPGSGVARRPLRERCMADGAHGPRPVRAIQRGARGGGAAGKTTAEPRRDKADWSRGDLAALVEWTRRYGDVPTLADWDPQRARTLGQEWRIARYHQGDWPSARTVANHFGSFSAAVANRASSTWRELCESSPRPDARPRLAACSVARGRGSGLGLGGDTRS